MNISEVAKLAKLPPKTIRYYEDIGLVSPQRAANGYRHFRDSDAHKLAFLAQARALGFPVEECRSLLSLWDDSDRASADVRRIAATHLKKIEAKIAELKAIRDCLDQLVTACKGDHRPDCPIIDALGKTRRSRSGAPARPRLPTLET